MKSKISWKNYKTELTTQQNQSDNKKAQSAPNEYERDLHTMTMKESKIKNFLHSPKYKKIIDEMKIFDQTDFDYFKYEKDLNIGDFDN